MQFESPAKRSREPEDDERRIPVKSAKRPRNTQVSHAASSSNIAHGSVSSQLSSLSSHPTITNETQPPALVAAGGNAGTEQVPTGK